MKSMRYTPGYTFSRHGDYARKLASMEAHRRALMFITKASAVGSLMCVMIVIACFL
jgi:hypothetical protein